MQSVENKRGCVLHPLCAFMVRTDTATIWRVSMFLISTLFRIFNLGNSVPIYTSDVTYINRGILHYTLRTYGARTSRKLPCFRSIDWSVLLRVLAVMAVRVGSVIEDRTLPHTCSEVAMTCLRTVRSACWLLHQIQDRLWMMWALRWACENGREWHRQDLVVALISDFRNMARVIWRFYM
jgi:hypothetical protein